MESKENDDGYSDKAKDCYIRGDVGVRTGKDIMEGEHQQQQKQSLQGIEQQPMGYADDVDGFMYGSHSVDVGGGAASNSHAFTAFTQPEAMTSQVGMGNRFTARQWQELERQTMMYKYMMSSVPVSSELQLPVSTIKKFVPYNTSPTQSNTSLESGIASFNNTSNQDSEPWRCKRTDGKKWRCSRDVAPDQKYCERHSHKSRPRSRKPVELQPKISIPDSNTTISNNLPLFSGTLPALDHSRGLGWFLKGENTSIVSSSSWQPQSFQFHDHISKGGYFQSQSSQLFSPKSSSETVQAMDVWSQALRRQDGLAGDMLFPLSSIKLTGSGSGDPTTTEGREDVQGSKVGVVEVETEKLGVNMEESNHQWIWPDSPAGGPLAEALCVGISNSGNRFSSSSSSSSSSAMASVSGGSSHTNFAKKS